MWAQKWAEYLLLELLDPRLKNFHSVALYTVAVFGIYEYIELRLINMNGYGGLVTAFLDKVAFISARCQLWTSIKFNNQTENLEMVNFAQTANIE